MPSEQFWAIVPAAGTGSRMQSDKPKQYLLLQQQTVLMHTLNRLLSHPQISGLVIAIAKDDPWWSSLEIPADWPLLIAEGGQQRSGSVLNALDRLAGEQVGDPWVLVHDAARPCLRHADINHMIRSLATDEVGGILAMPITDTVKRATMDGRVAETVPREALWRAATPQMFRLQQLRQALRQAIAAGINVTDEASAMEYLGYQPKLIAGHADNIKITLPQDLPLADLFLQQQGGSNL
ncbi:MAG: 2-C-methyl-D-erythritol 4-phosphate cytidylyltransferase [Methylophaga sp.]|nr:2-C-methyl-D-erythritol 4-phosphate cytidylyltransferase [Methylophaga sp.]